MRSHIYTETIQYDIDLITYPLQHVVRTCNSYFRSLSYPVISNLIMLSAFFRCLANLKVLQLASNFHGVPSLKLMKNFGCVQHRRTM